MHPLSREVHDFGAACEHLIAFRTKAALSDEEEVFVSFYLTELGKLIGDRQQETLTHSVHR